MKKGECQVCKNETFLEKHHILPKNIFKGKGKTIWLCPTCHTEYHQYLGQNELKNENEDFHYFMFWKWYATAIVLLLVLFFGIYFLKQYDSIIQFCQNS